MVKKYSQNNLKSMQMQNEKNVPNRKKLPFYGPLDIKDQNIYLEEELKNFPESYYNPFPYQTQLDSFDLLYQLGAGAFGVVLLVKYKMFGIYYAMKVLSKKDLVERNYLEKALNEKRMLQSLNCPFTVYLLYFSQDNSNIYLFLPFIRGGELYTCLLKFVKFSDNLSKFYAAQVILAFEYLHKCSVIYRDLKPENIILDHFGYIKLTDFGLAKAVSQRTYTFCGTPDYVAPEVILGKGYGKAVDWWSLGVLMFEMSSGQTPFFNESQMVTFQNITFVNYEMPQDFKENLKNLIRNLLVRDVTRRIGNLKYEVDDIKRHPWFKEIDWLALLNRRVVPPFVPNDAHSISNLVFPGIKEITNWEVADEDLYADKFLDF